MTYIPLARGFLSLVAVMDWASRKVLAWRLSNTLDSSFCVEALHEALDRYGSPEIFNTDQGSHFTSLAFTDVLTDAGIHISRDGKGRWMDNVFIERLWRSLKYEQVYLAEYATASDARAGIGWWIDFYNERRPHSSLVDRTPNEAYTLGATPGPGRYPAPSQPEAAQPMTPDFTLIWPLSCLKDGVHLWVSWCSASWTPSTTRVRCPRKRVRPTSHFGWRVDSDSRVGRCIRVPIRWAEWNTRFTCVKNTLRYRSDVPPHFE